jgi:hypothetical protein
LKVDKTIAEIQNRFEFDNEQIVKYIFDKLESERSLFWIQVARTIANRLNNEIEFAKQGF